MMRSRLDSSSLLVQMRCGCLAVVQEGQTEPAWVECHEHRGKSPPWRGAVSLLIHAQKVLEWRSPPSGRRD
ncbi:MAG: hypothetical protein Q8R28_05250 [Dehalococcoidia bacterium]|nr:hypothetical protein [Dehalococcoidia bacterium]